MKKTIKVLKDKQGITLMTSLIIFALVAILSTSLISVTSVATNLAYDKYREEQAFLIAESVSKIVKQEVIDNGGDSTKEMYQVLEKAKLSEVNATVDTIPGFEADDEVFAKLSFKFTTNQKKLYLTVTGVYQGNERSLTSEFDYDYVEEGGENPGGGNPVDPEAPGDGMTTHEIFQYAFVANELLLVDGDSRPVMMRFEDPMDSNTLKYKVEVPKNGNMVDQSPAATVRPIRNQILSEGENGQGHYIKLHQSTQLYDNDTKDRRVEEIKVYNNYEWNMPLWDLPLVNGLDPSNDAQLDILLNTGNAAQKMPICNRYGGALVTGTGQVESCKYVPGDSGDEQQYSLPPGADRTVFVYIDYSEYPEFARHKNKVSGTDQNIIFVLVSTGKTDNTKFSFKNGHTIESMNDSGRSTGHTIYMVTNDAVNINVEKGSGIDAFIYAPRATINIENDKPTQMLGNSNREPQANVIGGFMAKTIKFDVTVKIHPDQYRMIYFRPKDVLPGKPTQPPTVDPGEIPIRDNGYVAAS